MITLLDAIGPAVLRASWQAGVLAVVVMLVVRMGGERISPRWRYRLWSVVIVRLLIVVVPASPWSAFNLVRAAPQVNGSAIQLEEVKPIIAAGHSAQPLDGERLETERFLLDVEPETNSPAPLLAPPAMSAPIPAPSSAHATAAQGDSLRSIPIMRIVFLIWFAGCLLSGLYLLRAGIVLRRRLSLCRSVKDASVLAALEFARDRVGLGTRARLFVTPESISPCIVGAFRPRIIVPEALVTESSQANLRHVLAHELAHIVRRDVLANGLLLLARTLHWFNPLAWWSIKEMQSEREAACDDMALAALGESDRSAYASTIVELATSLAPSGTAPAMIGLISSTRRLRNRISRLVHSSSVTAFRAPLVAAIMLAIAIPGLTDAMPGGAVRESPAEEARPSREYDETDKVTLRGRCVDWVDKTPIAGATVHLFKAEGKTAPIVELAKVVTDREGRFEFKPVPPPRDADLVDTLHYLVFAEADDRPIGAQGFWNVGNGDMETVEIGFLREKTTLAGTVQDAQGRPVEGATVAQWAVNGRSIPGVLSATSGPDGRFLINRIPHYEWVRAGSPNQSSLTFTVSHRGHPEAAVEVRELPKNIIITLETGCRVTGTVIDRGSRRPVGGAVVVAHRFDQHTQTAASTDANGRFEMALSEDQYTFTVSAKDRVGAAITDRECLAGEQVELPHFEISSGGFISGRVVNSKTGEAIGTSEQGNPIAIGFHGPSLPQGKVISPLRLATVNRDGRYTLRAAPGENFPYFVNLRGDRMAWDTMRQPAVIVKAGETTQYDMLVTTEASPEEKLKAANAVVAALPINQPARTAAILAEFAKLQRTVDETELWCSLMRELVTLGPQVVPQICAELDRTTEDRTLRRLSFALRAIGDARAVPALIRAIPRTLQPSSSDYGLIVADAKLAEFMQKNDLNPGAGGQYFGFGRPERELFGALRKLTDQSFDDSQLNGLSRSDDPHRQALQRQLFTRHALQWQAWWEAHWQQFTDDASYQKVNIAAPVEPPASTPEPLGPKAHTENHTIGAVLSPAAQEGQYTEYFYDLDTGARPAWPKDIPRDEARVDPKNIAAWAEKTGVDLMCVTHRAPDGTQTFVLRSFGIKAWEISPRDARRFDRLIATGNLPKGREVGELLMHYDEETKQSVPDANGAFVFVTREGSMGLIETTDRVTQTADLTGRPAGNAPAGIGFKTGVRFDLRWVVP